VCERLRPPKCKDWNEELQALGITGLRAYLATVQVLAASAAVPSSIPLVSEERLRLARETGQINTAFPLARPLRSGAWRIDNQTVSHDDALLMAAHATGTTSGGQNLIFDAGGSPQKPQALEEGRAGS